MPSSQRRARYLQATNKPQGRTRSAPSKAAQGAPIHPPPAGGVYALLPGSLALLATGRTRGIRCARGVFCPCGGECGASTSRSECSRSFAKRKLPANASGGSPQDGQGSCERLLSDDACAGCRLLRGKRRMAAHDERLEDGPSCTAGSPRIVRGWQQPMRAHPWLGSSGSNIRDLPLRACGAEYRLESPY
jgi:hypothetical protein